MSYIALSQNDGIDLIVNRIEYIGVVFMYSTYFHFVTSLTKLDKEKRLEITIYYLSSFVFGLLTIFTNLIVKGINQTLFFNITSIGFLHPIFLLFFFVAIIRGIFLLIKSHKTAVGNKKNQILYFVFATILGFGGGSTTYLLKYNIPIFPYGHYLTFLYVIITAYAILRYRLMDITIVIRKGVVYSTIIALITAVYLLIIHFSSHLFGTLGGTYNTILTLLLIFIFAFAFQPLRENLQKIIDKLFFKSKYDYQQTIKNLSMAVTKTLELDKILDMVAESLANTFKIDKIAIFVDKKDSFNLKKNIGFKNITVTTRSKDLILQGEAELPKDASIYIPIVTKEKLIGAIILGNKLSSDMFTTEDIDLLITLGNQLGSAIENAKLLEDILNTQKQLYQADKMASLGTIAAGMTHEIKNPLTVIKNLVQITKERYKNADDEFFDSFDEMVPRQVERISNIVDNLLKFGRPKEPQKVDLDLNKVLDDSIRMFENKCAKRGIDIIKKYGNLSKISADPELLLQAFTNIILNSIQAMEDGGELAIKTLQNQNKIIVEISDTGTGIAEDNLKNIFDPFYTTKDIGTGLGLSVTYKIIKEHCGEIFVNSKVGDGTKFKIEFLIGE